MSVREERTLTLRAQTVSRVHELGNTFWYLKLLTVVLAATASCLLKCGV